MNNTRKFDARSHLFSAIVAVGALIVGVVAGLAILTSCTTDTSLNQPASTVWDVLDFHDGEWWNQGASLPVDCQDETSCEVLTGQAATDWADSADETETSHSTCAVILSGTSVVVCTDGFYAES